MPSIKRDPSVKGGIGKQASRKNVAFAPDTPERDHKPGRTVHPIDQKKLDMFLGSWISNLSREVSNEVHLEGTVSFSPLLTKNP